jgi:hypothetical protein
MRVSEENSKTLPSSKTFGRAIKPFREQNTDFVLLKCSGPNKRHGSSHFAGIIKWVSLTSIFCNTMWWPPDESNAGMANMIGK